VKELAKIVGVDNVVVDQAILTGYSSDISFVRGVKPDSIVRPHSADEITRIVALARDTRTPLVPLSSGAPHFLGDTVPSVGSAIIVDLSGMKNIVRVDRPDRVAMFEPGVTFGELITAVAREGLRLNTPLLPRQSKSVVGSMLERQPVIMPKYHWDIGDPMECVEVIFGTGDVFRTGSAAGPGNLEEQWKAGGSQKEAAGPGPASWYRVIQGAQGTMGIVTWATARCEIVPQLEAPYLVGSSQLEVLLELVHWLTRLRLVNECFVLNKTDLAAIVARNRPGEYEEIEKSLSPWILFFNVAGYEYFPEERVAGQLKDIKDITGRLGLEAVKSLSAVTASALLALSRRPSEEPYWKLRRKGGSEDIFFLSLYKKLPELIEAFSREAVSAGYPASEIGIYLQPIVQGTNCHCEFNLFYNPSDSEEVARVQSLSHRAVASLSDKGAFFSRPYGNDTNYIMNRDAATRAALMRVKEIVDPARILNPGKLCYAAEGRE
jgi:FAD/FMN-containing dehydrogenase